MQVQNRALCAIAQAESVRFKLLEELPVRRACYGVLRYIMENGAQGVEIIVSGKLRAQRAKAIKFKDGYMVRCGVVWTAAFVSSAYFSRDWLRYNEP